jgi:hypothetical protein
MVNSTSNEFINPDILLVVRGQSVPNKVRDETSESKHNMEKCLEGIAT